MFKHILLPTDGSPLSETAMRKGIQFAKTINARVTGFCVIPKLRYFSYDSDIGPEFKKQAAAAIQAEVNKNLFAIEKAAKGADVPCQTAQEISAEAQVQAQHSEMIPGDWGKVGPGWLTRPLSTACRKAGGQAGFTSSSGGVRAPSVTRIRNCEVRGDEKPHRAESSNPGWFRARLNRSHPEGAKLLL
jgi:hypothetical protein